MDLKQLQADVNVILKSLHPRDYNGESINWGDLSCVQTHKIEDQDGYIYYEAIIEEAAPDGCYKFCHDIIEKINEMPRYESIPEIVWVRTEW